MYVFYYYYLLIKHAPLHHVILHAVVIYIAHYTLSINIVFLSSWLCSLYLSLCCNRSKLIDSINELYTFRCLVISSSLLPCKFICLFIWSFSRSLCELVFVQWKRRWSIVWSSLPQIHFASSLKLKRWRYALVLPCVCLCMYVCMC
jgi:hypothetical protein